MHISTVIFIFISAKDDCSYDYLEIYHGNTSDLKRQGPYCGTEPPAPRTMAGPVTIRFVSDDSFTAHGFRALFSITDCGGTLTQSKGIFFSPAIHPDHPSEISCTWQIVGPTNKVIALSFPRFSLNVRYRCWQDYVEILDGAEDGPSLGRICGSQSITVKSTRNILTVKLRMGFQTKPPIDKGITAVYRMTYGVDHGCGGTFNVSSGEIQSLDIDSDGYYEPNLDCGWLINTNDADEVLAVAFETFDLEPSPNNTCNYDYVELKEDFNSGLVGRYCGSTLPTAITTTGNKLYINFHSDGKNNRAGFKLRFYTIPCKYLHKFFR
ncbi:cubilin [Trichonephila clavata]|uniref:Cubilin n=1 Tax=Trichonephila clavata TaxID=2740835 RepID=A0A8X6JKG4_TRICU|nr:cubilin [Trichonephila clavata]